MFAPLARVVLTRFRSFFATGDTRDAEILALRHQIEVLQRQINRPQFTDTDRTILATLAGVLDRQRLADVFLIVKPATVLGWYRRLVARQAGGATRSSVGCQEEEPHPTEPGFR